MKERPGPGPNLNRVRLTPGRRAARQRPEALRVTGQPPWPNPSPSMNLSLSDSMALCCKNCAT